MKKKGFCGLVNCHSAYDELIMMKYAAVCKERDERKEENRRLTEEHEELADLLGKAMGRERHLLMENLKLRETIRQVRELVEKYDRVGVKEE